MIKIAKGNKTILVMATTTNIKIKIKPRRTRKVLAKET